MIDIDSVYFMLTPPPITVRQISYWAKEPSSLANYQSSSELPEFSDVVIIGSGFSGASIAYFLSQLRPDLSITILEGRQSCSGASGRNGGHLAPNVVSGDRKVHDFEQMNYDALYQLIDQNKIDCLVGDKETDGYMVYDRQDSFINAQQRIGELYRQETKNIDKIRLRSSDSILSIKGQVSSGIVCRRASPINPYKLVNWILANCVVRNVALHTHTMVSKIITQTTENHIYTNRGIIKARSVIVATNAYTSALLPAVKIVPTRGQVLRWEVSQSQVDSILKQHDAAGGDAAAAASGGICSDGACTDRVSIVMDTADVYMSIFPTTRGGDKYSVVLGGARKYHLNLQTGITDDNHTSPAITAFLKQIALNRLNISHEPIDQWTGIMGFTDTGEPTIGQYQESVYVISGFNGHGMTRIFLSAKALVMRYFNNNDGDVDGDWPQWFPDHYIIKPFGCTRIA